ncbi:heme-binding domain-containing protein [Hanstruepera flava]|uniref:heme-binding domain-containing protein n=1 Tax=Hanstruepera flava TaxID=2930218 RepID=UPI0020276F27|nr:heme-binding domain-containing protein [Hanstruepera flava]
MKLFKKLLVILLVLFVIAQFFGPEKNDGDLAINAFINDTNPPQDVEAILKESCYDCHSNSTRYPWYNNITPVNYWLADHVKHGKGHFNVSVWDEYSTKKKDHKLEELIEMVEEKEMPLNSYTWTHGEAKLTDAQIQSVINWAQAVRIKYGLEAKPE